jgi:hypothetical protein
MSGDVQEIEQAICTLKLTDEFKARIEQVERDIREGAVQVREAKPDQT